MMYLDHYGLREAPFRLTPLTDFFFPGAKRGATVEALVYAVLHDEGIVKVSGEVGAGKTMLCRVLIERLPDTADTVYVANPTLEPDALLRTIANELGLSLPSTDVVTTLSAIQDDLIARHAAGRRVVVLIDEAHAMPAASLEQIRLLSNLETGRHKLMQLVLFGQPELDTLLDTRAMRPLKDRITHHFRLDPLSPDEVSDYLDFRMRAAGYRGPEVFSPAAARRLATIATGLTRRVNVLADKALLAAFTQNMHAVNPSHVKTAARDAEYLPRRTRRPGWFIVPLLLVVVAVLAWQTLERKVLTKAPAPLAKKAPAPAQAHAVLPPAAAEAQATAPDNKTVESQAAAATATPAKAPQQPTPADTPLSDVPRTTTPARAAETSTAAPPPAATDTAEPAFPLTSAALDEQVRWMAAAADETWFIQLHTNLDATPEQLEAQLQRAAGALPDQTIRAYSAQLPQGHRTGVIVGTYASEQAALAALRALPIDYQRQGAYIRQARRLR